MLRELIAWVLNNYLGKYVGNFNTAQLTVALLSGEVELENLPLRRDAFRNLGLPIQALSGTIGKIKLQIPVRQFRSAPWCIQIENVYAVIGPINLDEWNAAAEHQAELDYKLSRLDTLEAKWRAHNDVDSTESSSYYASSYTGWMNYGTSIVTNIVENLELKIKNVHLRYEDCLTSSNSRFACGMTIESLSARTCDSHWMFSFMSAWTQNQAWFKLVELESMSFYWDTLSNDETFGDCLPADLAEAFRKSSTQQHRYVMHPVSAQARLKRDRSEAPLRTRSRPRIVCDLILNEVRLTLNDWQYNQMVACVRGLDDIAKYRRFKLLRPHHSIQTNPKAWWLYAAQCHGYHPITSQRNREIARENLKYMEIYTKIVTNPNEILSNDHQTHKDQIEKVRSYDELRILREICMERAPPTPKSATKQTAATSSSSGRMLVQWFPLWWYNTKPATDGDSITMAATDATTDSAATPKDQNQLEDEILNALAGSVENNSLLKRDTVFGKFDFTLKKGTLDVCSNGLSPVDCKTMFQLQFENLLLCIESRPRSGSHFVELSLGTVLLHDYLTENSEFPDLIKPQLKDDVAAPYPRFQRSTPVNQRTSSPAVGGSSSNSDPLFQLIYERKPLSYNTDYRLVIKSQSLDIVYNTDAFKWLVDFVMKPHQRLSTRKKIEAMKNKTKTELIKNWEQMLEGNLNERQTWLFEIDISAPQIIFAETINAKTGTIVVIDFGRLQLSNKSEHLIVEPIGMQKSNNGKSTGAASANVELNLDGDDDEAFMTPCSTPPGSPDASTTTTDSPTLMTALSDIPDSIINQIDTGLNERTLHDKLYDTFNIDLIDLQVLVCKGKERWSFASQKGSSPLHVLDRFSISLHLERRVVYTADPQYPSLTLSGSLPKIIAHINEHKIEAICFMLNTLSSGGVQSPYKTPMNDQLENASPKISASSSSSQQQQQQQPSFLGPNSVGNENIDDDPLLLQRETSKLIMLHFAIDQMALELQSRGRSIVELQVTGVKAGFSKRPEDTNFTLSVHGLLLVDAIQSFGPDFELLIASHRHVGIDSVSGSLKHSEPCSPSSGGLPDHQGQDRRPTSPHTISKALSNLQRTNSATWTAADDLDALITVEVLFVTPEGGTGEHLQIANIQFNNLDIIANQETIVELIGFVKRVMPKQKHATLIATTSSSTSSMSASSSSIVQPPPVNSATNPTRTEITFDFNRLNVLVLRAIMRDDFLIGRKVGTFTMSETRIHATLGSTITVEGSLGGLQVLDLTPEGVAHQRILSVGKDPLTDPPHVQRDLLSSLTQEIYAMGTNKEKYMEECQALSFQISRTMTASVSIKIRMASVWYTHCARFMQEISWCATEFKHYLKNLAKSIREKATDMALGLVQPRSDLALNMSSATGPTTVSTKCHSTPRKLAKTLQQQEKQSSVDISLDIVLDTPVLVLPRSSCSPLVLVAHLGQITVTNKVPDAVNSNCHLNETETVFGDFVTQFQMDDCGLMADMCGSNEPMTTNLDTYLIDVRNINLFSLDTTKRKGFRLSALPRAEEFYACHEDAIPVLHDTAIHLEISRSLQNQIGLLADSFVETKNILQITGSVVKPLNLSLSKVQFEQLIETIENIFKVPTDLVRPPSEVHKDLSSITKFSVADDIDVPAFEFDARLNRGRLMNQSTVSISSDRKSNQLEPKVNFELPIFVIQLKKDNDALVEIFFRDFNVTYERNNLYETNVQVSLRSLLMEDLLQPPDSKHRAMVVSAAPETQPFRPCTSFSSRSCPNLAADWRNWSDEPMTGSLPENLECGSIGIRQQAQVNADSSDTPTPSSRPACPDTPPPSPQQRQRQDNLVLYSLIVVDPSSPNFHSQYNSVHQSSSIDFNSLNLIISVQSWIVLLNFFGLLSDDSEDGVDVADNSNYMTNHLQDVTSPMISSTSQLPLQPIATACNSELDISIRSLTLVFIRTDYEIAKANVSSARFVVRRVNQSKTIDGRLGSISLIDLTKHGSIYRERFLTSGNEALSFVYRQPGQKIIGRRSLLADAKLSIQMSSVRYVHTKRFVAEIQAFFKDFQQLQTPVLKRIKPSDSKSNLQQRPMQLELDIKAGSPIILLPLSSRSDKVIVADLGEFSLRNSFHLSNENGIISIKKDLQGPDEILDVMLVDLVNTDLFAGMRHSKTGPNDSVTDICMDMGTYLILKKGANLLNAKCHLKLIVERNMDSWRSQNTPDFSVQGTFSRLEAVLNLQQYQLIRGFLSYNLGEAIDDLFVDAEPDNYYSGSRSSLLSEPMRSGHTDTYVWTNTSITLDLQDVSVGLQVPTIDLLKPGASFRLANQTNAVTSLACINFIKSSLKIDSFSDGSQDIDLVSQEILITDSRFLKPNSISAQKNVFTNILQPINFTPGTDSVQAEIHCRKRRDASKYTILLNNMRLIAILDWLECVKDFLAENADEPKMPNISTATHSSHEMSSPIPSEPYEVILNITDSELVFVETPDQWDTNAVILKSTTVVSYRPVEVTKVASINLNHLEVFSCIMGFEEETALSIIDPVTINLDIRRNKLDVQLQKRLCIRLSYNDVKMFTQMFKSLPQQTRTAKNRAEVEACADAVTIQIDENLVAKLCSLGFKQSDCINALNACHNYLDDAALWLTQNAEPTTGRQAAAASNPLAIQAVQLRASFISICVIDDCKDADVPLLELSLSELELKQELPSILDSVASARSSTTLATIGVKAGYLKGTFASEYYNRALSGWEPLIEPWKCEAAWNYSLGMGMQRNRLNLKITSDSELKLNITTTIIELYQLVHENWTQDYYAASSSSSTNSKYSSSAIANSSVTSPTNYRRRTPFVPFALKNDTGGDLWFTTILSSLSGANESTETINTADLSGWTHVEAGATQTFSFGPPNKQRHLDSHKTTFHQVCVRADGWTDTGPVSVDKVGIFFRHARRKSDEYRAMPRARIVFAVTLEGSAQKLVTVRSALRIANNLDVTMLMKMEHFFGHLNIRAWPNPITANLKIGEVFNVPLSHVHAFLFVRPLSTEAASVKSAPTDSQQLQQLQKFNGNDYWNKSSSAGDVASTNSSSRSSIKAGYQYCEKSLHWKDMDEDTSVQQELRTCKSYRDKSFRFVAAVKREGFPKKDLAGANLPGHLLTIWPPLRLNNLLSCDLLYKLPSGSQGRISPAETAFIYEVDLESTLEISLTLDSYPGAGHIIVPNGHIGSVDTRLKLTDTKNRPLNLHATILVLKGQGMQITISAAYWLVNRTGLPLIFRQDGVQHESAGQFTENEQARLISPLMFSFTDLDASPALTVRLGRRYGDEPPWCQSFHLQKDIFNRQLKSGCSNETFILGVEVRRGRGRYMKTSVVTFSPRFQLYNRSSHKLVFAQKYYATTLTDPLAKSTFIEAVPDCHLPFHWPRLDKDQELCIRMADVENCLWSGAIPIHETQSLYINIRNVNGDMHFLRLEIVLQGATYFLLFGDAQALPPPIRIDNYSDVSIKFCQPGGKHQWQTVVRPHLSLAYVLDEPMGSQSLNVEAPGGISQSYSLRDLGVAHNLTYENFIYIAFSGTFRRDSLVKSSTADDLSVKDFDLDSQQLVFGVVDGRVVLCRKQPGDRSQLWRMNKDQQLEHEGSSPPTEPGKKPTSLPRYVLDLDKPPQPMTYTPLVVRTANKQRRSTQTWHFTEEGRLMCEHSNMCVQTRNGFFGLHANSEAVLGRIVSDTRMINESLVPLEQAIEKQKLRPGSGFLSVVISMDGPIKTIQIKDVKSMATSALTSDPTWRHVSHILPHMATLPSPSSTDGSRRQSTTTPTATNDSMIGELHINLKLSRGLGISLISRCPNEELAFVTLENIAMELIATPAVRSLDLSVGDVQIDNQLFETPCPVMLFTLRPPHQEDVPIRSRLSSLYFNVKLLPSPNTNAVIFEHLLLSLCPVAVYLEERLILRLAIFMGLGKSQPDPAALPDESDFEAQRVATQILAANAKRYYFGDLQVMPTQCRLSVITASKLSAQLSEMKKSLGLKLIKFEDATVEFDKFTDKHHFETLEVYWRAIQSHYKNELKWQAASILGSVDFLGNPLGFANDLSEGVSGLLFEGSVTSLVKNVTHGISNSTAKLTETFSDGLGCVVLDEQDTETRKRILEVPSGANSSSEHIVAGLKGFGFGLLGGVTSIVKHTYAGAQADGFQGLISGFGKGVIGTVAKPVIGVLDLASETANALRETSKSSHRTLPDRKRVPRCMSGTPVGLLPPFSLEQSKGQQHLFLINKRDFSEQFMAYEPCLLERKESKLRLLVSTENVWVFSRTDETTTIIFSYHLSELLSCHPVIVTTTTDGHKLKHPQHYIELCLTMTSTKTMPYASSGTGGIGHEMVKRPRVRCQTEEMSQRASRHINYAKSVYNEREHTLNSESVIDR